MKFLLTQKAQADLRAIALFTEKAWGRGQRNLYIKQLDNAFHLLADNPLLGKSCDYIKIGYRKLPQGSHIIFYRAGTDAVVEIVRVLHKGMDVEPRLT